MYGSTDNPFSTAFLARRPAPSITEGLLVLVQLVIADMTTEPIKKNSSYDEVCIVITTISSLFTVSGYVQCLFPVVSDFLTLPFLVTSSSSVMQELIHSSFDL